MWIDHSKRNEREETEAERKREWCWFNMEQSEEDVRLTRLVRERD